MTGNKKGAINSLIDCMPKRLPVFTSLNLTLLDAVSVFQGARIDFDLVAGTAE